ncbi:ABC transporter ATP-binding protein [Leucobacter sp. UCMA 4100]|nr:ABC transporter ATP-binding protein [Leucobacter sp. UCMA 4100]
MQDSEQVSWRARPHHGRAAIRRHIREPQRRERAKRFSNRDTRDIQALRDLCSNESLRRPLDRRVAAEAIEKVGIGHLSQRVFAGLSGGEKQRALIARALAQEASHLLLDEPTNHLDVRYQHETLHLVRELGTTTIVVLHDLNLAARYCDRLVLLYQGKVVAVGTPDVVLTPEILEPVYGITVERVEHRSVPQLVFTLPGGLQ